MSMDSSRGADATSGATRRDPGSLEQRAGDADRRDLVEEASEESFPASDAPSWGPLHAGSPDPRGGTSAVRMAEGDAREIR